MNEQLQALLGDLAAAYQDADPAPWRWVSAFDGSVRVEGGDGFNVIEHREHVTDRDVANAYLIAEMHRALPLLIAEIHSLRVQLYAVKSAAMGDRFYIDHLERRAAGQP